MFKGLVKAPESIVVDGNTLYATTHDGKVVKVVDGRIERSISILHDSQCEGSVFSMALCGRPLGMRRVAGEKFVIAHSLRGIYTADFETGEVVQVFSTDKPLDGKRSKLLNDLVVIDGNALLVTGTSTNYGWDSFLKAFLEHASDGRVLQIDMKTGEASVVMDGLNYVNGIEKHADGQSVIVVESGMARILRYYYAGPKKGTTEVFANNLPGFPDNIRTSTRGTFYAALAFARHPVQLSPLDATAEHPTVRKVLGEVTDAGNGTLYLGSFANDYVAQVKLA